MTGSGIGGGLGGPKIGGSGLEGRSMGRGPLTGGMVGGADTGRGVEMKSSVMINGNKDCCRCVRILAAPTANYARFSIIVATLRSLDTGHIDEIDRKAYVDSLYILLTLQRANITP